MGRLPRGSRRNPASPTRCLAECVRGPLPPLRGAWRARTARPATRIRPGPAAVDGADTAACARPSLIIDAEGSVLWLQQAETELVGARRMVAENAALRPLPSAAVWHCQQAVEMALKSAMLCTGGLTDEEFTGRASHDLSGFRRSFERAQATTREQRRFQQVPATREDLEWLRRAYLAARYPNASTTAVPAAGYTDADARHAIGIAEDVLPWAACLVERGRAADVGPRPTGSAASSSGGLRVGDVVGTELEDESKGTDGRDVLVSCPPRWAVLLSDRPQARAKPRSPGAPTRTDTEVAPFEYSTR